MKEQLDWIHIDDYLYKFEAEERSRCKGVNLSLLNEDIGSSEDEDGDVADEFDDEPINY